MKKIMMKEDTHELREDSVGLILLLVAHAIFLTYSLLGHVPMFKGPLKSLTGVAIVLLIFNFFRQHRRCHRRELLWYGGLMVLALIHSYFSGNFGFFKLMLFAGSLRRVNFKRVVHFDLYLRFSLIVLVAVLCTAGVIPDIVYTYEGMLRRSMGFTNPNTLGIAVFVLVCDILYVCDLKLTVKSAGSIAALSVWLYAVARCRTAAYVIIGVMAIVVLYNIWPGIFHTKAVKVLLYAMPILLSIVTLVAVEAFIARKPWAIDLNLFLSGRLNSIASFVRLLDPVLFGQPIHETLDKTLDNTFAFVWYDLGIAVMAVFLLAYARLIRRNFQNNMKLCLLMLGFMVYGLNEHLWINVDYNVFMLAFGANPLLETNGVTVDKDALDEAKKRRLMRRLRRRMDRHSF